MTSRELQAAAARLKAAREGAGFDSAAEAARAAGVEKPTYHTHEAGTRGFKKQAAAYARLFGTTPEWLMYGRSRLANEVEVRYTVRGNPHAPEVTQDIEPDPDLGYDVVEIPPGMGKWCAARVEGSSMEPMFQDGTIVVFKDEWRKPDDLLGFNCVLELSDGRVLIKRLVRGDEPGLFNLESSNAPVLRNQEIVRASKVEWFRPG